MKKRSLLIGPVFVLLAGCLNYTTPLAYTNQSVPAAKQGHDCQLFVLGYGSHGPDLSVVKAVHQGGITRFRTAEYQAKELFGMGNNCIVAYGE